MYRDRMIGYYPQAIQSILEFQAIVDGEHQEFNGIDGGLNQIILDAYLTTMSEERIKQWEKRLNIQPLSNSTLSDRRETIIARIRGQGKLNTESINRIVNTFTGGTAKSWIEDSILHVEITPAPGNKDYQFINLKQELVSKIPAHLGFEVYRVYPTWGEVKTNDQDWLGVHINYDTWDDVRVNNRRGAGQLDITDLDEFILDRG